MLRNRRGATSLRWLRALLDHGITVHGQVVVCPGVNDGDVLDDTLAGVLDQYPELAVAVRRAARRVAATTPSRACGPHTRGRGARPSSTPSSDWQADVPRPCSAGGSCSLADEYYLLAGRPFPRPTRTRASRCTRTASAWRARSSSSCTAASTRPTGVARGFFAWVDGAPGRGLPRRRGDRCRRRGEPSLSLPRRRRADRASSPGEYGARVLAPLVDDARPRRRAGRAGRQRVLRRQHRRHRPDGRVPTSLACSPTSRAGHRYLLPDVCLSEGRFLDGTTPGRPARARSRSSPTDGIALRAGRSIGAPA